MSVDFRSDSATMRESWPGLPDEAASGGASEDIPLL
jgi:hypothetical protein